MLEIKVEDIFDSLDKIDNELNDLIAERDQALFRLDEALVQIQLLKKYLKKSIQYSSASSHCRHALDKVEYILRHDAILQIQHISENNGLYNKD
jgi:hypothetical protein